MSGKDADQRRTSLRGVLAGAVALLSVAGGLIWRQAYRRRKAQAALRTLVMEGAEAGLEQRGFTLAAMSSDSRQFLEETVSTPEAIEAYLGRSLTSDVVFRFGEQVLLNTELDRGTVTLTFIRISWEAVCKNLYIPIFCGGTHGPEPIT